ncbi:MAG TPA: choice-of-anchor tandem repeat GloVer-containing protein [Chitinophagales bacterium]|nr:choice-of-anchor tandem repeat GloVer-containing protein [Chitinophagales bacterium]
MKTILRLSFVAAAYLFAPACSFAGVQTSQLWTSMLTGGSAGLGVIYVVNSDGNGGTVAYAFNGVNGANPSGNMVQGQGNILYGTTTAGGAYNHGVLFSLNTNNSNNSITVLHDFNASDGAVPRDLIMSADGKIYGTTQAGGSHTSTTATEGCGTLYTYDTHSNTFTKLIDFNGTVNGENPQGLIQGSNGLIYGMARQGGAQNLGVIYSFNPAGRIFNLLHTFSSADGALPTSCHLTQAGSKWFGMTTWGGNYNMGVIFSLDMQNVTFTKLMDFNGSNGAYPTGTLTQASNGLLYGVTSYGGPDNNGTMFSFNASNAAFVKLHDFDGTDGADPYGALTQATDGNLYGITTDGGSNGTGVIYSYDITTNLFAVVQDCDANANGASPMSTLLELQNTTGINTLTEQKVSLYPNPVAGSLLINTGNFKPSVITITDLNGRQVLQAEYANTIDVSTLPAGAYIVEMHNSTSTGRARFLKM